VGGNKGGSLYRVSYSYVFPVTAAVTPSFPSFQSRLAIFLLSLFHSTSLEGDRAAQAVAFFNLSFFAKY
jgi:hypothetical protein